MDINERIGLGTVQFGLRYGINNQEGQVSYEVAREIIQFYTQAVCTPVLDTAAAYGESEAVIGRILASGDLKSDPRIISKVLSHVTNRTEVRASFDQSVERLQVSTLYGYLAHDADSVINNPGIYQELIRLKEEGKVRKIGISAYYPAQLQWFLDQQLPLDLVQIPYNIFDNRFGPLLQVSKEAGIEIHTRSAFLQGLFYKNVYTLPPHFDPVKERIAALQQLAQDNGLALNKLLLIFCLTHPAIDKVIIGVDSRQHILENRITEQDLLIFHSISDAIKADVTISDDILLPIKWPPA